jgi:AmiR/NasT family two-component response regulator
MTSYDDLKGKRIVICEDEGLTVMQLERALTRAGLIVVGKAGNGTDCVNLVLNEKPDIVLMDIVMPGETGLEATRRIMGQFPTCIVMLTANSDEEHIEQAKELGAAGYIPKPITTEQLMPALRQALQMFYECRP